VGAGYKMIDLGSHNGVYLNGEKLAPNSESALKFNDSIRLGETELVLQEAAPDDEGELAGRRLGSYQLVKRIGSGGMGEVYRAVQIALGRPVAIKILSPELTEDVSFVQRFMTEARAAGKLNHPNVVQVHEVGESDGIYYYSMEFLAGGSVQDQIRGGRKLPVERAIKIVLGAAKALEYAEKQGVIHCDIKPDNLMLTEDGEVRLADLGIARTVASRGAKVKQEGGVLGSPHYMAPEQAAGEAIDHRVDVYGLGATAYTMLSGRTLFTGESQLEIMSKHVNDDPENLGVVAPWVPKRLCKVVMTMVAKDPADRYQSAAEAIQALQELSGAEDRTPRPSELRRVPTGKRKPATERYARERRNKLILAGVVVALVVLTILLLLLPH
jgi:serine/threonine-protein kinase